MRTLNWPEPYEACREDGVNRCLAPAFTSRIAKRPADWALRTQKTTLPATISMKRRCRGHRATVKPERPSSRPAGECDFSRTFNESPSFPDQLHREDLEWLDVHRRQLLAGTAAPSLRRRVGCATLDRVGWSWMSFAPRRTAPTDQKQADAQQLYGTGDLA